MPTTGKVVASITNGTRVDALGWDPAKKLIYIPNGGEGNVTVVHQDSPDKYTVVATVPTFAGAKTITVDPTTHNVYLFQPERGPAPPAPAAPPPTGGGARSRPAGPVIAAGSSSSRTDPDQAVKPAGSSAGFTSDDRSVRSTRMVQSFNSATIAPSAASAGPALRPRHRRSRGTPQSCGPRTAPRCAARCPRAPVSSPSRSSRRFRP